MTIDLVLLTPAWRGAIATVAVIGDGASEVVARAIPSLGDGLLLNRPRLARIAIVDGASESVVVCRVSSATNTPRFEVHCHGGTLITESVIAALETAGGARRDSATWRDPDLTPISNAAVIALAACRTDRAAKILLDQYHGALEEAIRNRPDEVSAWRNLGKHLTQPWRVVIAGRPNVGKSSLLNAIVGFDRAIVDSTAGTTRDVVSHTTVIDGWAVELCDTAGLHTSNSDLENTGMDRTRSIVATADIIVEVIDATNPKRDESLTAIVAATTTIFVVNKVDLLDVSSHTALAADVTVSATTGLGISELVAMIIRRLVPKIPPRGTGIPFGDW